MTGYRLELWRHGFTGTEAHPLRRVQALIRARAAAGEATERRTIMLALVAIDATVETDRLFPPAT